MSLVMVYYKSSLYNSDLLGLIPIAYFAPSGELLVQPVVKMNFVGDPISSMELLQNTELLYYGLHLGIHTYFVWPVSL
jgi:hypothetical protein